MATYSPSEALARLRDLPNKFGQKAKEIMQEELPKRTGELAASVTVVKTSEETVSVGPTKYVGGGIYERRSLGAIIRDGRPELYPKHPGRPSGDGKRGHAAALRWEDDDGVHYRYHVNAAKPNDFLGRTRNRLRNVNWTLEGGE